MQASNNGWQQAILNNTKALGGLEVKVDRLESKVEQIEVKVDRLESKVEQIEADVATLKTDISEIKPIIK